MSIKDKYRKVIHDLVKQYQPHVVENPGYTVKRDATLGACIGYTKEYIYDGRPHYRYDKYKGGMTALNKFFPGDESERVAHLDVGSGPGLFSWVVYDYFMDNHSGDLRSIDLYCYDAAENMKQLAETMWQKFEINTTLNYYLDRRKEIMVSDLIASTDTETRTIITFGHILVQVHYDRTAIDNFAYIVGSIAQKRKCYLLAIDAHTGHRPANFENGWKNLEDALANDYDAGVNVAHEGLSLKCAKVEIGGRR